MGRIIHLGGQSVGLNVGGGGGRFSLGGRAVVSALTPAQALLAQLQGIDPTGGYYRADDYTASTSQAGLFVDAYGGSLVYQSPNVMASPTRVVDPSGMVYVSADGADDTAIGSASQTVACYTAVFRSPLDQSTWPSFFSVIDSYDTDSPKWIALFQPGTTVLSSDFGHITQFRRNGVAFPTRPYDMAPITAWQVVTIRCAGVTPSHLGFFQVRQLFGRLHLAALRTWPADPSADVVAQTEQALMSYYSQQYGLTFS